MNFSGRSRLSFSINNSSRTTNFQFGPLGGRFVATAASSQTETTIQVTQRVKMRNNIFATGGTAKRFAKGVAISGPQVSNTVLIASQVNLIRTDGNNDYNPGGPLGGGGTGYFGFKNMANGKTYYGWMRVQVMVDNRGYPSYIRFLNTPDGIFGAYASKDDPQWVGGAFKVGDSYTGVVPEPSTLALEGLGLLALGAAGVREMRRRRQTEAAA